VAQLAVATHLVVVGYSFRDDHVNHVIRSWLADHQATTLVVIDPYFPAESTAWKEGFQQELRIRLIPPDGGPPELQFRQRMHIIRARAADALPNL
jgi:hypothetical protein